MNGEGGQVICKHSKFLSTASNKKMHKLMGGADFLREKNKTLHLVVLHQLIDARLAGRVLNVFRFLCQVSGHSHDHQDHTQRDNYSFASLSKFSQAKK